MRDAFGGVFTMKFLLVFIFIYVAFTAVSLNYAKAFRIKNKVIDFVEQNEIVDLETFFRGSNGGNIKKLDAILTNSNYNKECVNGNGALKSEEGIVEGYCYRGIVLKQKPNESDNNAIYYEINTYAEWNLGALNKILALGGKDENSEEVINGSWKITGEAKVIKRK